MKETLVHHHINFLPIFERTNPNQSQLKRQKMLIGRLNLIPLDFIQLNRHFGGSS